MKYSILSSKFYDDEDVAYRALKDIMEDSDCESILISSKKKLPMEEIIQAMGTRLGFEIIEAINPIEISDATIVFYEDNRSYEIHKHKK